MSKKSILKGTFILTVAGLLTKLLGFYNRIFLTALIGVKELGVYQLIFPLYMLAFSISSQGISTTITKHISFYIGRREKDNAKRVLLLGISVALSISMVLGFIMNVLARPISIYVLKNVDCTSLLKILSIGVPFVAVKACLNAFFVGINKPGFQGTSQFVEQVFRIGSTYILSVLWSADKINAKAAVIAVCLGEIIATVLSFVFYLFTRKTFFSKDNIIKQSKDNNIVKAFSKDAVPITMNNVLLTLFTSLEAIILPSMLFSYYADSNKSLEIFGMVTGVVMPFLLFPSTITSSLSTMLLPAISYANAKNDTETISVALKKSMLFCISLGIIAWLFYNQFGELICTLTFKNKIAGKLLANMSFLCPLIYISGNLTAILNGLDKTFINLIYHVISIIIRIIFTVIVVPVYGLTAYIAGMTLSYVVLDLLMVFSTCNKKTITRKELPDIHNN